MRRGEFYRRRARVLAGSSRTPPYPPSTFGGEASDDAPDGPALLWVEGGYLKTNYGEFLLLEPTS
jgi:hypothetical protein